MVAAAVTDARGITKPGFARLPGRGDAGRTELAERLLASQSTFAGDVLRATTPLPPARAAPAPARAAARPRRPHLRGGPGPPPAIGPLPSEPIAVRRRLAYHLEQRAKARNHGATVTGPWNRQAQYLGAFIRNRRKLARLSLC